MAGLPKSSPSHVFVMVDCFMAKHMGGFIMVRTIAKKSMLQQAAVVLSALTISVPCYAGVVFEDNFDNTASWNTSGQYDGKECSPLGVGAPSQHVCESSAYPANWSAFRSVPGASGLSPVVSINRPPDNVDHTNGAGKAAVIRQQSVSGVNWPGDGILLKYLGAEYNDLYIQFWIKSQKGWQFNTASDGYFKMFRVSRKGNLATNWFDEFTSGTRPVPQFIVQPKNSPAYGFRHEDPLRGYPDDGGAVWKGVCTDTTVWNGRKVCNFGLEKIEDPYVYSNPMSSWTTYGELFDGSWHRVVYRLKMNTPGSANGILQMWIDGTQRTNATQLTWIGAGGKAVGWNQFGLGGNGNNTFNASKPSEQWYSIDDVVVSTTPIPDNYVIGGGTPAADTTAPTASITYPASNASLSGTVSVNATAADNVAVSKVELYVNNILQSSDTTSPYVLSWNTAALANGTYSMLVKAYDAAGNVGQSPAVAVSVSNSQTIDTSAPTVAISAPTSNATVSGIVTVAATATDNVAVSKVEFYDNDVAFAVVNTAPHRVSLDTTKLANGSHSFKSRAYDTTGNVGQSSAVAVTVNNQTQTQDVTAPTVSITSPASNATVSGNLTISASATDNVGIAKVEFYVNGALHNTDTSAPFSYGGATTSANNGTYTLYAKAYDAAGNVKQSSTVNFTINNASAADTTAPTAAIQAPTSSYVYGTSVAVKAGASDNVAVKKTEIYIDGVLKATANAGSLSWTWILTGYAKGSHVIMVKSYDAAGNVGTKSKTVTKF